jgi:23S rRNA A2030 N6-methylase RlmJ
LCECPPVNPYAADPGDVVKHLVLAELLHVERRRITTYIDTHSGRPWNDLIRPGYTFGDADRQPRAAWADDFMKLAVSGVLGRDVKNARYTKILQTDRGSGMFWRQAGLSSRPVYPGSVGIALASDLSVEAWFCGEINSADQKRLRAALPPGSVFRSLISAPGRARVDRAVAPDAFVLVDPFDLHSGSEEARSARDFVLHASREGALVEAWYPLFGRSTPTAITDTWRSVAHGLNLEVRWSAGNASTLQGAGIIVTNPGEPAALRITTLMAGLEPIYGKAEIRGRL